MYQDPFYVFSEMHEDPFYVFLEMHQDPFYVFLEMHQDPFYVFLDMHLNLLDAPTGEGPPFKCTKWVVAPPPFNIEVISPLS